MKTRPIYRSNWAMALAFLIAGTLACNLGVKQPTMTPPHAHESASPTLNIAETDTAETTPTPELVADKNLLYQDDFTNPASGWSQEKFDNYFIGYHEPEYYHIEITSPNYKTSVFEPNKQSFSDVTVEVKALAHSQKTATSGDFTYGPVFRRSGDQYYAFAISPRTKQWYVLKSSPSALVVLAEGTEESIHDLDEEDTLRVDARGSDFSFYINDQLVGDVNDADYITGEVGLYVQTFDSSNTHIHFDQLTVRKLETLEIPGVDVTTLYKDDFTNPTTGWPEKKFDNYFIGYHEPEYYHIEITSPNYKTSVFEPSKQSFSDVTIEIKGRAFSQKTAPTGDFTYGPAFRRSGDQYYAFTISPRTKQWYVLKSSPSALVVLAEGTEESIHDLDEEDILRVDARGSDFSFYINDQLVSEVSDVDYASGEVGLYVQTLDSSNTHIHFDQLTIRK